MGSFRFARIRSRILPGPGSLRLARAGLVAVLLGCAGAGPVLRPADFPLHVAHDGFLGLHWRVERTPDGVVAVGIVEVFQPERIAEVGLDLQGLDRGGQVVSRVRGYASPRSFTGTDPWPFEIRLRPGAREERFELRVAELVWKVMRAGG
jgi:hypothetical protein